MAEPETGQALAARESTERHQAVAARESAGRPWAPVVMVVAVVAAFVVGWRTGRGWGRLIGW
jgi:hypothetical protein